MPLSLTRIPWKQRDMPNVWQITLTKKVVCCEFFKADKNPPAKWSKDGVLSIRLPREEALAALDEADTCLIEEAEESGLVWVPVRAAFRYVTIAPWSRIPVVTKTLILNPIISCLSGGRNKLVASKAYDFLNAEYQHAGLAIRTPETITDVSLTEIPLYVKSMGYCAVIKVPYSNAGQGVFTISNKKELDAFMALTHPYEQFVVQGLVGNSTWSSKSAQGTFYHVGTIPNLKNNTYVADVRMMVYATKDGYRPLACYARRAKSPLKDTLDDSKASWDMLGTNLSILNPDGSWSSDTSRLILMDRMDFNKLGISIDDLIDGFVQTVLSSMAIDKMSKRLLRDKGFDSQLFVSLNKDDSFTKEMMDTHVEQ
mmetsp:Transcript_28722/g.46464  ORF Transcript_28722/g.46464 Transcript_28722/m.46464 type:complete len:369 (+) Transcript_28722:543-1649(+)